MTARDDMETLPQPLLEAFDASIAETRPLSGGDLSDVTYVKLDTGREMVVKSGPLVHVEARMLAAMAMVPGRSAAHAHVR